MEDLKESEASNRAENMDIYTTVACFYLHHILPSGSEERI